MEWEYENEKPYKLTKLCNSLSEIVCLRTHLGEFTELLG